MRRTLPAFFLLAVPLLSVAPAAADTIYFKNGTSIEVPEAREIEGFVVYTAGKDVHKIPRAQVERIVKNRPAFGDIRVEKVRPGQVIAAPSSADFFRAADANTADTPEDAEDEAESGKASPTGLELRRFTPEELAALEKQGPRPASDAYFTAGRAALQEREYEKALAYMKRAYELMPEPTLLEWQASILQRMGRHQDSMETAERAARLNPGSATAFYLKAEGLFEQQRYAEALDAAERATRLDPQKANAFFLKGRALYELERYKEAMAAWKQSQAIHPSATVEHWLAKVGRDADTDERLRNIESTHFSLRYEGPAIPVALQRDILPTLEDDYLELRSTLGDAPPNNLLVMVYGNQTYQDVTDGPEWSSGLYDGRLRVRAGGATAITQIAGTLKHELAHSFIGYMTRNRCPGWLNEGLAQMLSSRASSYRAPELLEAFQHKKHFPMKTLELNFGRFNGQQAQLAYLQSLATVEYLRSRHGMNSLLELLAELGRGAAPEQALRNVLRMDYEDLEREVADHWQRTYGKPAAGRR